MRTLLIAILLLLSPLAGAQSAQGALYEGRVPVADQGDAARDQGFSEAFAQVLERVSGQPAGSPQLLPLMTRAPRLVQRYSYERDPETNQLLLVAAFDPRGVDNALRTQRLPTAGAPAAPLEEVELRISGINGIRDYGRGLAAAQALPGVRKLAVIGADDTQLLLRATVAGGTGALLSVPTGALVRSAQADGGLSFALAP